MAKNTEAMFKKLPKPQQARIKARAKQLIDEVKVTHKDVKWPKAKKAKGKQVDAAQFREAVQGYLNTGEDSTGILSASEKAKLDVTRGKVTAPLQSGPSFWDKVVDWFKV